MRIQLHGADCALAIAARILRAAVGCGSVCASLILLGSMPVFAEDVIVEIKPSCSVRPGSVIKVGDIADVRTPSARLKQRIEELDVADALSESAVQRVNRRELEMRILLDGIAASDLVVIGSDQAIVQAATRGSFIAGLEQKVAAELVKQFGLDQDAVSVQINNQAALQVLESQLARDAYRIRLVFGDRLPIGRSQFECRFETARGNATQRLDAFVTVTRAVAMTTMPILSGTRVDPSMIQVVKRPMVSSVSYVDPESIVGKTASRNIESNQLLQASFFRSRRSNEKLVKRYDLIDVYIQFGAGQVRLKDAKVMSAGGNAGDTIEVLNTRTNKRLSAIVVDRNTAKRTPLTGSGR